MLSKSPLTDALLLTGGTCVADRVALEWASFTRRCEQRRARVGCLSPALVRHGWCVRRGV
jgi:hypothetical protein